MKNAAKRVVLDKWEDTKNPRATARGRMGEVHDIELMQQFGISYRPPSGAEAVAIPINGSNDQLVAVGFTGGSKRPVAGEGELILYSLADGNTFTMTADGRIIINTTGGGEFELVGEEVITNMTIRTTGDVIADGISLKEHVHGGVKPGGGLTDIPQ